MWRNKCRLCGSDAPGKVLRGLRRPGADVPWDDARLGAWANGPPRLGQQTGASGTKPPRAQTNELVLEALREVAQATGKDMGEAIKYVEEKGSKPAGPPPPVDLRTKSLQDLLGRRAKKCKQVDAAELRVKKAEAKVAEAVAAAKAERDKLDEHKVNLLKLDDAIREAQAKAVLPELPEQVAETDPKAALAGLEAFHKLLERGAQQFNLDLSPSIGLVTGEMAAARTAIDKAAGAGDVEMEMELRADNPAVAQHLQDAGISLDDKDAVKRLLDGLSSAAVKRAKTGLWFAPQLGGRKAAAEASGPPSPGGLPAAPARSGGRAAAEGFCDDRLDLDVWSANVSTWSSGQGLLEWARHDRLVDGSLAALPLLVCLQEHRIKSQLVLESASKWVAKRGFWHSWGLAQSTGEGSLHSSGGVSVLSRLPAAVHDARGAALPGHRVASLLVNVGLGVPLYVISLYLVTSIGFAGENLDMMANLLANVGSLDGPWLLLGDWNMLGSDVLVWSRKARGVLLQSHAPTCGSREIDFGVCSELLAPFVAEVSQFEAAPVQTHSVLRVRLQGLGRAARICRPQLPLKFPIEKPPPVRPAPPEAPASEWPWTMGVALPVDLGEACAAWFQHAETYLAEFHD
ncbi:unnamed protein product [Prorocentrum cordatum]|uniref:Endonuclease/exonuclease/phosphatase domain-containing protein n=1 Tax=Prorocentrum cordatum TaxID=2364126 RepID=A0ABN9QNF5_9DINO|nr:unnamed protein product [Polarella glacialis]